MAKPPPAPAKLPPPTAAQCWLTFWAWVLGIPLAVAAILGVIWAALWALGSTSMDNRAAADMVGTLWWLGIIVLLYPAMLWVWWGDLREGLKVARDWEVMTPLAQEAALAGTAVVPKSKRHARKQG